MEALFTCEDPVQTRSLEQKYFILSWMFIHPDSRFVFSMKERPGIPVHIPAFAQILANVLWRIGQEPAENIRTWLLYLLYNTSPCMIEALCPCCCYSVEAVASRPHQTPATTPWCSSFSAMCAATNS